MSQQLKYPIGIQTFEKLRKGGFVYVDKTEYIQKLVENSGLYYFLSRPRRFGKSLLLSTIEAFFLGKRELFKGLAIENYDHDWLEYPILHLDFTGTDYNNPDSLHAHLNSALEKWESLYGDEKADRDVDERFGYIIEKAYRVTGRQVVILIDEYDKPLLETVDNPEQQSRFRNTLRGVYGNLKNKDAYIKFAMLTGITKFGHLSIFSDLNNLNDISMNKQYGAICGITAKELVDYFQSGVKDFAQDSKLPVEEIYDKLRKNYDGYHFSPKNCPDICNPFSPLNALDNQRIANYWHRTGTPTFLIKLFKSSRYHIASLNNIEISADTVENISFDITSNIIPVLYQSGYLTIKGYREDVDVLKLGFPNQEVEKGFLTLQNT